MYLFKVKGTARIPDYVQLRDANYTLVAYFRADRPEKALEKAGFGHNLAYLVQMINQMPYGVVQELKEE